MANRQERARIAAETVAIAWGYGGFANGPATVARRFGDFVPSGGAFGRPFEYVTYAVLDRCGETIATFVEVLGGRCDG